MVNPGHSILLLGQPGSGKSSFALKAAESEGSAVICLAPGLAEETSYRSLRGNPSFIVQGYDDPEFFPSTGTSGLKVQGYDKLLTDLRTTYSLVASEQASKKPKVLVTDTFSAMSSLAMNKTYAKFNLVQPPAALSPDGAAFWGYYRNLQDQLVRIMRALRGSGMHWICTSHIDEKQIKESGTANPDAIEKIGIVPAIAGGFRNVFAGEFDLVMFARVEKGADNKPIHYLQWQTDPKRPTKSRFAGLAPTGKIANDWKGFLDKVNTATGESK